MSYEKHKIIKYMARLLDFSLVSKAVILRPPPPAHLLLQDGLVLLGQFLSLHGEAVPLVLQLFVQSQLVLVHLCLQLVLQAHQLLLVLPPHALVPVRTRGRKLAKRILEQTLHLSKVVLYESFIKSTLMNVIYHCMRPFVCANKYGLKQIILSVSHKTILHSCPWNLILLKE